MSFYFYCIFCHPQKPLHCHPQLDWGSRIFLFFFNTKRKGIYLGFCIKYRITKNTSWIPAIAGMTLLLSSPKAHPLSSSKSFIEDPVFLFTFFVFGGDRILFFTPLIYMEGIIRRRVKRRDPSSLYRTFIQDEREGVRPFIAINTHY